ncbi:MAG TPA: hypothetical protein VJN92_06145 [Candidatus Acidoferrum sp.]|nr:hypothetical protein [Candidatus Acidoferrum sp.]
MAKKLETIWRIDPHTQSKHTILRRYWEAWLPIMTKYNQRVLYIDGFAGPGRLPGWGGRITTDCSFIGTRSPR